MFYHTLDTIKGDSTINMSRKDRANTENLQVLLEQHWLHCRHLESERAWFMSVYAAITGGIFAFMAYNTASLDNMKLQSWWPLLFLIMLTFVGFFLSMRWTYSFECHRVKVNELARILWAESKGKSMFDPTMNIPAMRILPEPLRSSKIIQFLRINRIAQSLNEVLRTRYLFPSFYFVMLVGLVIASLIIPGFPIWGQAISMIAVIVAAFLFFSWHTSLKELGETKKVVLEGCNGEWAQQRYLPSLVSGSDKRNIQLWAFDLDPEIKLPTPVIAAQWQSSHDKGKCCYQNKSDGTIEVDRPYQVDYVFVVTPDHSHSKVVMSWLKRLAQQGQIFIEKPLDAKLSAAEKLRGLESIFAFDHYLARAYPFLLKSSHYLNQIGRIQNIDFHLLEAFDNLIKRSKTLNNGAIWDLFCHALVVICAAINHKTTCSAIDLDSIKRSGEMRVRAAQVANSPISGDTLSRVTFTLNHDIDVLTHVGYHRSNASSKYMSFYGTKGTIKLDFSTDEFTISDTHDKLLKKGTLFTDHVEIYLERLLYKEKHPLLIPGVLNLDAALEIMDILDKVKQKIGDMPVYKHNDSIDKIFEIIDHNELH